jgi:hypothetical protein
MIQGLYLYGISGFSSKLPPSSGQKLSSSLEKEKQSIINELFGRWVESRVNFYSLLKM